MLLSVDTKKNLFKNTIFKKYERSFRLPVNRYLKTFLLRIFHLNICCVFTEKVMWQREIIKMEVNPGDFQKRVS